MKLFAPKYYKKFKCIADKCCHSCCVGWEIDVDPDTLEKYSSLAEGYGTKIKESIDFADTPHFRLCENEKCPHLDDKGLCRIISECGEDYLCDICREHPRFYNYTARGKEVGIGLSCEEAARIVLSSDDYNEFYIVEELDGEGLDTDFDAVKCREQIYRIISDRTTPYPERIAQIRDMFELSLSEISKDIFLSLEYLDETHKELFLAFSADMETPKEYEKMLERALAYFIYRHCSGAYDREEFRASLGFALFCERHLASLISDQNATEEEAVELARIISEEIEYSEENTERIKGEFYL